MFVLNVTNWNPCNRCNPCPNVSAKSERHPIEIDSAQNTWYDVDVTFTENVSGNDEVTVIRTSVAGEPIAMVSAQSSVLENLGSATPATVQTIGFTVGEQAEYHFRALEYVTTPARITVSIWGVRACLTAGPMAPSRPIITALLLYIGFLLLCA